MPGCSTGAGNLFMVFGEPDLDLRTLEGGKLQVELHGLDVYDPTTGEIRSDTTDDIVVVGGWVPHLYEVFEPPDDGAVSLRTRDVDVAVPRDLREPVELQRASA